MTSSRAVPPFPPPAPSAGGAPLPWFLRSSGALLATVAVVVLVPVGLFGLAMRTTHEARIRRERVERVDMEARMAAAAKRDPQPELELRAERTTEYQQVAEILSAAARAGLGRIRFITEPAPGR